MKNGKNFFEKIEKYFRKNLKKILGKIEKNSLKNGKNFSENRKKFLGKIKKKFS